ncbi:MULTISPECIES: O-antigen ligase family protein [unclassified Streptomyces]|uniref:O-antigen ligase family protein n=1 Tax=unclassified Streptomyces TaxID=2593676 RepID=UPI0033A8E81B
MTSTADAAATGERRIASDVVGVVVLAACAGWSLITAAAHDGRPEGMLLAVLAVAAGYAAGRVCGALLPVAAPCAAAAAGLGLAIATPGPQISLQLGHTGATAALLALSCGAACCAAWAARRSAVRLALWLSAAGTAVTAAFLGSTAGVVSCAGVLLCSLATARVHRRALGLTGFAAAAALVTGATWAIAEDALPGGPAASLNDQLTDHRILLWHDALRMARTDPGLGVGPGRYGELSPTVAHSLLPDGKPHSAPLQQAAEQGLTGLVLLAAAFCWVLYALLRSSRTTPVALTAGAALTAVAAIASIGNALSFMTVTAGAGLLAGFATARPLASGDPDDIPGPARHSGDHLEV